MPAPPPRRPVVLTALDVLSALGRGPEPLLAAVLAGEAAFGPISRFATGDRAVRAAAHLPGRPDLAAELLAALKAVGADDAPVLLALHSDAGIAELVSKLAHEYTVENVYTCACVAASTAVADAAAAIALGRHDRVVVAAGYLVEPDTHAVFDAGRALARDGVARPFSRGRSGLVLGDAVGAVVLEAEESARERGAEILATIPGWGRAGDAHHVCRPSPDGSGLGRAVQAALDRAGLRPADLGYVNANATGSAQADGSEVAALRRVLGTSAAHVPVSSTKSVHGHALEASALLELVVTVSALRAGTVPVNAGYLGDDMTAVSGLDLVLAPGRPLTGRHALTLNSAFGGANTALLVGAP